MFSLGLARKYSCHNIIFWNFFFFSSPCIIFWCLPWYLERQEMSFFAYLVDMTGAKFFGNKITENQVSSKPTFITTFSLTWNRVHQFSSRIWKNVMALGRLDSATEQSVYQLSENSEFLFKPIKVALNLKPYKFYEGCYWGKTVVVKFRENVESNSEKISA